MKCPFELPVRKKELPKNTKGIKLYRIDKKVFFPYTEDEVDYIVQAINSHEKLLQYKDYVESRISQCTIPNEWLPLCFSEWDKLVSDLAQDLRQALKEAEKQ